MDADELLAQYADELLARYASDELLDRYHAGERDFVQSELSEVHLSNANLCDINLEEANLSRAKLYGVNLSYANLNNANLSHASLYGVELHGTNLSNVDLRAADLRDVKLCYANLNDTDCSGSRFIQVDFEGADLSCADLSQTDLRGANLNEVDLSCVNFSQANLSGANLANATQGFNQVTRDIERLSIDLKGANLSCADLSYADLSRADLRGANLKDAILLGTNLDNALLEGTNLDGTILAHIEGENGTRGSGKNLTDIFAEVSSASQDLIQQIAVFKAQSKRRQVQADSVRVDSMDRERSEDRTGSSRSQLLQLTKPSPRTKPAKPPTWENLKFRSLAEVEIAQALDRANLLFFTHCAARLDCSGVRLNDLNPGFLVCYRVSNLPPAIVRWGILVVDRPRDDKLAMTIEEQEKEINFERGGVRMYRFSQSKCLSQPDDVVREFIQLLNLQC
jgi:uncharacterized protein YjbI with pentapeptide repeats